ncbi:hypothetical protein ACVWY3_007351 [Bradyrhizobium sp. USDA 4486]
MMPGQLCCSAKYLGRVAPRRGLPSPGGGGSIARSASGVGWSLHSGTAYEERLSPHLGSHCMRTDPRASYARPGPLQGRMGTVDAGAALLFGKVSRSGRPTTRPTLPWRGRVDRAKRERGGVISPLGHRLGGDTVTPPRFALHANRSTGELRSSRTPSGEDGHAGGADDLVHRGFLRMQPGTACGFSHIKVIAALGCPPRTGAVDLPAPAGDTQAR